MDVTVAACLKESILDLVKALGDIDNSVNNSIIKSISKIANEYPNEVIEIICDFYKQAGRINVTQTGNIVKVLERTCVSQVKKIEPGIATELVHAMLRAMTENPSYEPTVQLGASAVLVAIGHEFLDLVLRSLINELSPATLPHYTIAHTMGTLSMLNTKSMVPHIKEILGKMLPLLPLVRQNGDKQAFAYAFGHFAVAVAEQIGDNVENENITSIKENFVTEFSIVFDVLYNQWLNSSEPRVSESVLEALGPITRLISERQFNETVNKFVLSLLSLYRKPAINFFCISQCISYLLSPSSLNPKLSLNDNVVNSINHVLFSLVLFEPDYDQPQTVKNHFEVLRCFDHMATQYPDQTIEMLLHLCKNTQEKERMRAVVILTHLTTCSQVFIDSFATKFITILKVMIVMEQGIKMKKTLVKAIVALAYRNCIMATDDFAMVEFIVKHCGYEGPSHVSHSEAQDVRDTCKNSLILMCNTVTSVRTQLLNLLLNSLTLEDFTHSMSTVSHCLTYLLQNNSNVSRDEPTETVIVAIASADVIFVRCLMHIVDPNERERNKNLLIFLEEFSGDIHKNLKNSWTIEIDRLLKYVEKNESKEQWHGMLLDLLVSAVEQVNNNKWVEIISTLISQQIMSKKLSTMIKGVSLQYLSVLSCHMSNAAAVENVLKIILLALKAIPFESVEYVSTAIGIASRQHGEFILNELDALYKENEARRSNKLLNFLSSRASKNDAELAIVKYALIICYGKVARECLDVHVLARLGDNVTSILFEILKSNPGFDLCNASVTTLYEISKALHPASHHNVALRNRWQLLNAVLEQIYNSNLEKRNVELYPIIVKASKALTKLQKGILPEERNTILRVLFNSIFGELSSFKRKYEIEGNGDKNDLLAKTLNDSLTLLHELIKELIIQSTCLSTIDDIIGLLIEWFRHENDEIRTAAILILQVVFDSYIKNVKLNYETPSKFGQMGYLLGLIVPGVADTNFPVRLTTVDCVKLIIQIQDLYEGHTIEPDDECMVNLAHLQNNILTNDLYMISDYCMRLCDTISPKIPHLHTMQFIESLLESYDGHELRSVGISSILDAFFVKKGQDLYQTIERIVEVMLIKMEDVPDDSRARLMRPLMSLMRHHSNAVTAVLLAQRIPLKPCVVSCWRHLARDEGLAVSIVDNFLRLMTSVELYEDPYHITEHHIAALQPMTLISALGEMLQEESMRSICINKFSDLFAVLYTTLACYVEAEPPAYVVPSNKGQERFGFIPNREAIKLSPAKITVNTFNSFLERADCYKVKEACSLCLSIEHGDSSSTILELAPILGSSISRSCPAHLAKLVSRLGGYCRSPLPPQRCAVLALMADLLNYRCNENPVLIEAVLANLSSGWKDESPRVRSASLRGAANISQLNKEQRAAALPAALAALSQGVDAQKLPSPVDNIPLAAIQGLSRLLTETDKIDKEFDRELSAISQKIRPFMNTDCSQLRENSIRLFGIIAERVNSDGIIEQGVSSLPCFLLHLCDNNPAVVRACKSTLRQIFKTFKVRKSNDFIQTHLVDEGRLYLDDFLCALMRQLADEMPSAVVKCLHTAVNYLHTAREDLKPFSPLLVGYLYADLYRIQPNHPDEFSLDPEITRTARTRLLQLLKDANPAVRQNSAFALANICLICTTM